MQRMQFRAKSAKNDLKPTEFLKHNFHFEKGGVCPYCGLQAPQAIMVVESDTDLSSPVG